MNPDIIATRWKVEYSTKQAQDMATAMLDQVKASGEREAVVRGWLRVCRLVGVKA